MFNFDNKLAVVTGGGKGIGKAIAEKFIENGAEVIIVGKDDENGYKTIKDLGSKASYIHCDLAKEEEIVALSEKVIKEYGTPDILINNAGIFMTGDIEHTEVRDFRNIMETNLFGSYLMCYYFIGHMKNKGKGVIINVASEAGISAFKNQIAYNTSKAALIHLSKSLAVDYAEQGIRVNILCPGTTETPLFIKAINNTNDPEKERKRYESIRPMNRLGKMDEIASAALVLASEELGYATGAVLVIDGGYVIQ